jgi:hypothetical protein
MSFQSIVFFLALILVTTVLAGGTSKEGLAFLAKKEKEVGCVDSVIIIISIVLSIFSF